jgi:hypothetical protein
MTQRLPKIDARSTTRPLAAPCAVALVVSGAVALAGCTAVARGQGDGAAAPSTAMMAQAGAPATLPPAGFTVACGAGQQALVSQTLASGQPVSHVECVPVQALAGATARSAARRVAAPAVIAEPPAAARPAVFQTPPYEEVVAAPSPRTAERRDGRTWKKSAVIVGSSAGIGAGIGGAVGGKKGALIGAAIGGGGAAIWDQATRR